jgi:hypothetical protein
MKRIILIGCVSVLFLASCMTPRYAQHGQRPNVEADSSAMTKEDVIVLVNEGIGDDVIIDQIKATHSYFQLTTDDIVALKQAGVSEDVIRAMIQTTESEKMSRRMMRRSLFYPDSFYYGYTWYPWYYAGFAFRPYYPRVYYFGSRVYGFHSGPRHMGARSGGYSRR